MNKLTDSHKTHLSATCLLLSVAEADEIMEQEELKTICDILIDFFSMSSDYASKLLNEAQNELKKTLGLFEFGQHLNSVFDHSDKIDFIGCVFEIAYSDGDLHYLEHHTINKIAGIFNLHREDIITSKIEIKNFLS